jgi:hypothetical protein
MVHTKKTFKGEWDSQDGQKTKELTRVITVEDGDDYWKFFVLVDDVTSVRHKTLIDLPAEVTHDEPIKFGFLTVEEALVCARQKEVESVMQGMRLVP